jgi:hypothetical protein
MERTQQNLIRYRKGDGRAMGGFVRYDITFKKQVAALAQTGEHTMANIARRAHVNIETIARWTRDFARPRWLIDQKKQDLVRGYIDFDKTPPVIALPDADIAIDVGLTVDAVRHLRLSYGAAHKKRSLYMRKGKAKKDNKKAPTLPYREIERHLYAMFKPLAARYGK